MSSVGNYMQNVAHAVLGIKKSASEEPFSTSDEDTITIIFWLIMFFLLIVTSYASARLSYCYNISIGNTGSALAWAFLCFFFNIFYIPYYGIFLNPVCASSRNAVPTVGGKKRN